MIHPRAAPYRDIRTDHEPKFRSFLDWCRRLPTRTCAERFAVQVVSHPNFDPRRKDVAWFVGDSDGFQRVGGPPEGFLRANTFKNLKTESGVGHAKGMFYELNLYLERHAPPSAHHDSLATGNAFERDASVDGPSVGTKGARWQLK